MTYTFYFEYYSSYPSSSTDSYYSNFYKYQDGRYTSSTSTYTVNGTPSALKNFSKLSSSN